LVLLKTKPRTTIEGANASLLFWQTRNYSMLSILIQGWMEMDEPALASLAENLWWFTLVATGPRQRLLSDNPLLSLMARPFQLRVAMLAAPEHSVAIVEGWRWELANGTYPDLELHRLLLAGYVLPYQRVPLRAAVVVGLLGDVAEAAAAHPEMPILQNLAQKELLELDYLPDWADAVSTLVSSARRAAPTSSSSRNSSPRWRPLTHNCESGFFVVLSAEALKHKWRWTESGWQNRNGRFRIGHAVCVSSTVRSIWVAHGDGYSWLRQLCAAFASRSTNTSKITNVLTRRWIVFSAAGDLASHSVHDRRASIFFSEANYAAAEEEWHLALADWPTKLAPFDRSAAFAARSAGISAARQERWAAAADWFKEILPRLPTDEGTAFMAGAHADAGYCLWKAAKTDDAISALIEAWRLADTLPLGRENLRAFITRKTVGHVIAWLHGVVMNIAVGVLHEPVAGTCSSAQMPERMKELPETESANTWLFLMRLERKLGAGNRAAELGHKALLATTDPATQSIASMERIEQNLAAGKVATLPADIIALARAIKTAAALAPEHLASAVTVCHQRP
jgi:tetratricopeptide (TPR) repeat protein